MRALNLYSKERVVDHMRDLEEFISFLLKSAKDMPPLTMRSAKTPSEISVQFDYSLLAQSVELLRSCYHAQLKSSRFFLGSCSPLAEKNLVDLMTQLRDVYVELENKGIVGATRAFAAAFPHFNMNLSQSQSESDSPEFEEDPVLAFSDMRMEVCVM